MEKSKEKAQAKAFFKKPFNSQELLSVIAETLKPVLEKPKLTLQALLLQEKVSARDKIKALDRVESITGLDLVYILSLLIHSNLKGHLNVKKGPDIYSISFSEGSLVKVEGPMTVAIVKDLLVKKEYLSVQDIQVLNEKKIKGDFVQGLIDENYISPHILPEIRNFQAITEIKNLVNEEEIEINFSKDRKLDFTYKLDENLFHFLLSEIIEENFDMDWFKDFYLMLKNHPLKVNASDQLSYFKQMPIVTNVKGLFEVLEKEPTIGEILSEDKFDEDRFFRAIHFLAVNRIVTFSESVRSMSVFSDLSRLKALNDKIQQLDPFQIFQYFGSKKSCPPSEVNRLYKEFAKSYHPDKLSGKGSEDQKQLLHELFARVTEAHSILTDEEKRSKYTQEMEQESVEKQLKSEGLLEEGVKFLKKSDFESAKKLFQAAKELYTTPRLNLLCLWVQLKLSDFGKLDPKFNQQVDAALEKYYEHERNTFEYMMVKGLQLAHQH
ncbi:MAG: DnaJ domain-containing protein, partial [Bdellovibrionales bacterium]|nr:DnaJ domain-containing protein [Bdellovibrionales bacterium]